jgi:hypothetical protein
MMKLFWTVTEAIIALSFVSMVVSIAIMIGREAVRAVFG